MAMFVFFVLLQSAVVFANGPTHGKKVVCYMHSWSNYRTDLGQFSIEDIEPSLCTNIIYSFALLDEKTNTIRSGDAWQDLDAHNGRMAYRRVTGLRESYPHLKVSLSLGGWADGSTKYSTMAASAAARKTFIQSVVDFLKQHNFDGLDMHWKFPTLRGGSPSDKENYVLLIKELKEAFAPHNYLLTAAFGATKSIMEAAYELARLDRHLDYIHLLAFDYHGAWDGFVGSNAPLRGMGQNDLSSLEFSINYMISNGVSPGKIILGLPAFGRTFELLDPAVTSVEFARTRTKPEGFQGPYTTENGLMGYNEICMETSKNSSQWSHHWEARSATAYIRDKERVVCYDSGRSIAIKVKMAVDRGLGGFMMFSLETDDFRGLCDAEEDPYIDFQKRYLELIKNPELPGVIRLLNIPLSEKASSTDYYLILNGQLSLRLPQQPSSKYYLLRTVNTAAELALKERSILDALPAEPDDVGSTGPIHGKTVVCYMHSWSHYRRDLGQFSIEDIEPSLCTNIIYSFAVLDEKKNTIKSADLWQDLEANNGKMAYRRVTGLKEVYPHLKVSISLGGWVDGSVKYSNMAASPATRRTFIQSVLDFLKLHNFDGLDMHWKFPTMRDGKPYDKENYVILLKELKEAFAPHNYLLTAAFSADKSIMEAAYELSRLDRHLDYMHLLAFDYHGAWDGFVGSNAPLRGTHQYDTFSLEFSVNYMISQGVSPGKIVLGLPAFGRTFELLDPAVTSVEFARTRTKPEGFQGPYTAENGLMGYNEICMELSTNSSQWTTHWDANSATAYIRNEGRVITFDSGRSISSKVKFAVDRGLGGLMLWTLDTDDFRGLCGEEGSYVDFRTRLNELKKNPALPRVIRSLSIPTLEAAVPTEYYVIKDGQLHLRLPERTHSTFSLLRTVNTAASLALQERMVVDELHENDVDPGVSGFRSDYVYHVQAGYWFKGHSEPADWHTARLQCHYEGAVLASPLNKVLATALDAIISSFKPVFPKTRQLFIGVHQTFGEGMYTSVEGIPLDRLHISKWKDHQPKSHKREQCLALASDGVQDYSCREKLPYICYRKFCAGDRVGHCGTIDKAYKLNTETGHCYKLHTEPAPWPRALRACGAEGGHLAVANSAAEARVLGELAGRGVGAGHVILGLRKWENAWWNVHGESLATSGYSEWCRNCSEHGSCGAMLTGKLAAVSCDTAHPFICEKEMGILTNATGAACPLTNGLPFLIC